MLTLNPARRVAMLPDRNYTTTERKIVDWLSDGLPHKFEEYLGEVYDISERRALSAQVGNIRRKLNGSGYGIICESQGRRKYYRMIRFLYS